MELWFWIAFLIGTAVLVWSWPFWTLFLMGTTGLTLLFVSWPLWFVDRKPRHSAPFPYPHARRGWGFQFHNDVIPDPYKWMEKHKQELYDWVKAQDNLTETHLSAIPAREKLLERLRTDFNYERTGLPVTAGQRTFFMHNSGLQDHDVLYVVDAPGQEKRVLLDLNKYDKDYQYSLAHWSVSPDGEHLAYSLSRNGGTNYESGYVINVTTGQESYRFGTSRAPSFAWTPDSRAMYFISGKDIWLYKVGEWYPRKREHRFYWPNSLKVTDDGRYLVILSGWLQYANSKVIVKDLTTGKLSRPLNFISKSCDWNFVGNDGSVFYFRTNLDAPRGRLIAVDISKPNTMRNGIRDIVPEPTDKSLVLRDVSLVGDRFFVTYLKNGSHQVNEYDLKGTLIRRLELPDICTVIGFFGGRNTTVTQYAVQSFTSHPAFYSYDLTTGASTKLSRPEPPTDWSQYTTDLVFAKADDGTALPVYISYKKGLLRKDGTNPLHLYGYGGFNIALTPNFVISRATLMDMGVVFVQAVIRGGGEGGDNWHKAGMACNKQRVFDDFITCARFLIKEGYTSSKRLAIVGGSNGGLLVGACMTQEPELFAAAIPICGVLDMLAEGRSAEYGSAWGREGECRFVYSPYHSIRRGVPYPATYIQTAWYDDIVAPAQSFKFAAHLQWATGGNAPCLLRVEKNAGHKEILLPLSQRLKRLADEYAFLVDALKIEV